MRRSAMIRRSSFRLSLAAFSRSSGQIDSHSPNNKSLRVTTFVVCSINTHKDALGDLVPHDMFCRWPTLTLHFFASAKRSGTVSAKKYVLKFMSKLHHTISTNVNTRWWPVKMKYIYHLVLTSDISCGVIHSVANKSETTQPQRYGG